MALTLEDRDYLYAPFEVDQHEAREGATTKNKDKISWYIYIRRKPLIERLEGRFWGAWTLEYHSPKDLKNHSEVYCRISIHGLARENNGSGSSGNEHEGKSAATDAFKRACSNWGMGLYLQDCPQIWTAYDYVDNGRTDYKKRAIREKEAMQQFAVWFNQQVLGNSGSAPQPQAKNPTPDPVPAPSATPETGSSTGVTEATNIVVTKKKDNKQYMVIEGCTLWTRQPLRDLGYTDTELAELGKIGTHNLPDKVQIVYKLENKFKHPLRIQRVGTGKVVEVAA